MEFDETEALPGFDADDLAAMSAAELGELFRRLERHRRAIDARLVAVVGVVDRRGEHRADGHATPNAWCRALANWSDTECRDRLRAARAGHRSQPVADAIASGRIGVAQGHVLAQACQHPRVGDAITDIAHTLVEPAEKLPYRDFADMIRTLVKVTDLDGSDHDATVAHEGRRASLDLVGDELVVRGRGGLAQGSEMWEIFQQFVKAEFDVDWDRCRGEHGDAAHVGLLERTDAQRRWDALHAIFLQAVSIDPEARAPEPLVHLAMDVHTLQALLADEPIDDAPADPRRRYCHTRSGFPVPASDVLAALWNGPVRRLVVDESGVVINLGRTRRLFTGNARHAALFGSTHCAYAGCNTPIMRCQVDHQHTWSCYGRTDQRNAAPLCSRHNRWRERGYTVTRDTNGYWHTHRPDGTRIGPDP